MLRQPTRNFHTIDRRQEANDLGFGVVRSNFGVKQRMKARGLSQLRCRHDLVDVVVAGQSLP